MLWSSHYKRGVGSEERVKRNVRNSRIWSLFLGLELVLVNFGSKKGNMRSQKYTIACIRGEPLSLPP